LSIVRDQNTKQRTMLNGPWLSLLKWKAERKVLYTAALVGSKQWENGVSEFAHFKKRKKPVGPNLRTKKGKRKSAKIRR